MFTFSPMVEVVLQSLTENASPKRHTHIGRDRKQAIVIEHMVSLRTCCSKLII